MMIQANRLLSLDVFRGLTIVLMILVNSQGNDTPYPLLEHASWNGCTFADLVFPAFLFIVGVTAAISLDKASHTKSKTQLYKDIIQRSIILFVLGVLLNAIPYHFDLTTIRIYGILQRIALCYLFGSIIYLHTQLKSQIVLFFGILVGYWFLLTQIPVPGMDADPLSLEGNWVGYIDRLIFSASHLYLKIQDPEGLLSTIPSMANTLAGLITGSLLLSSLRKKNQFYLLLFVGLLFILLGAAWNNSFPFNKNLWTSSFVLWTTGWALIVFSLCFLFIDILGYKKWALPFKIFGSNALFAFVVHVMLLKIQSMFILPLRSGASNTLKYVITDHLFATCTPQNAALYYSLGFFLINFILVALLYRHKLFIRI